PRPVHAAYPARRSSALDATGLTNDATGTVVTVGASDTILTGDLVATRWVNNAGSISYAYAQTVASTVSGKRFNRTSGPNLASPISNITSPQAVTAGYGVQWAVTFDATGLSNDATGTVVTVGASDTILAGDLVATRWANNAGSISYAYAQTVASTVSGKRFNRTSGPNLASPISNITSPQAVTAGYGVQYKVTFKATGLGALDV